MENVNRSELQISFEMRYFSLKNVYGVFEDRSKFFSEKNYVFFEQLTAKCYISFDQRGLVEKWNEKECFWFYQWMFFLCLVKKHYSYSEFINYFLFGCVQKGIKIKKTGIYYNRFKVSVSGFFRWKEFSTFFLLESLRQEPIEFRSYFIPFLPMLSPPQDWDLKKKVGGYLSNHNWNLNSPFLGGDEITLELKTDYYLKALNRLQRSKFRINWNYIDSYSESAEEKGLVGVFRFLRKYMLKEDPLYFVWCLDGRGRFYTKGCLSPISSKFVRNALLDISEEVAEEVVFGKLGQLVEKGEKRSWMVNIEKGKEQLKELKKKDGDYEWMRYKSLYLKGWKGYLAKLDAVSSGSQLLTLLSLDLESLTKVNLLGSNLMEIPCSYYLILLKDYLVMYREGLKKMFRGWEEKDFLVSFYPFFKSASMKRVYGMSYFAYQKEVSLEWKWGEEKKNYFLQTSWIYLESKKDWKGLISFFESFLKGRELKNQMICLETPWSRVHLVYGGNWKKIRQSFIANVIHTLDGLLLCILLNEEYESDYSIFTVHDAVYVPSLKYFRWRALYSNGLKVLFDRENFLENFLGLTEKEKEKNVIFLTKRKKRSKTFPWKKIVESKNAFY